MENGVFMRLFYVAFGLIILNFSIVSNGHAASCPPTQAKNVNQEFVNAFLKLAETMNVGCLATFSPTEQRIFMEYISADDNINSWKRMLTVTLYDVGQKSAVEAVIPLTSNYLNMVASLKGNPEVIAKASDPKFGDLYGFKYGLKNGSEMEYGNGVVRTVGDHLVAIILYQQREEIPEPITTKFLRGNGLSK